MQLNDAAVKLDSQLDLACKKCEKVCFDNGATELKYTDETSNKKCKYDKTVK